MAAEDESTWQTTPDVVFGYYMAVRTSVDKSGVQCHVYNGSAQTWRLTPIEILQSTLLNALYFRAGDIWLSLLGNSPFRSGSSRALCSSRACSEEGFAVVVAAMTSLYSGKKRVLVCARSSVAAAMPPPSALGQTTCQGLRIASFLCGWGAHRERSSYRLPPMTDSSAGFLSPVRSHSPKTIPATLEPRRLRRTSRNARNNIR